jgi:aerobic carbon-monoxide dehydrogenase large subunit
VTSRYVGSPVERRLETVGTYEPTAVDAAPDADGRTNDCTTYGYGVQVSVVEVDVELGTVAVLDYAVVHDCGQMINPTVVAANSAAALLRESVPRCGSASATALTGDRPRPPSTTT